MQSRTFTGIKAAARTTNTGRIKEEIATLERRLAEIGPDGDCGYEKALIRFFEQQLGMRRAQLRAAE